MSKQLTKKAPILFIYGPTGVGKTDVALAIAATMPSEIINMDVGQFYTPFSIGTAKPDWKHSDVPHHFFDIINDQTSCTAIEYRAMVQEKIEEIRRRSRTPIIVGGSGFYLYSLLFSPGNDTSAMDITTHQDNQSLSHESWETLYKVDPQRAQNIDKHDTYRITRALDIWKRTGQQPTTFVPYYYPIADYILIYVHRDTHILNTIINKRVEAMIDNGWIQETKQFIGTPWQYFIQRKKLIGYNEIIHFLNGPQDKNAYRHMIEIIGNKTRQYAKRQRTFWRKLERDIKNAHHTKGNAVGCIESLDLTNTNLQLYINELLKRLYPQTR